MTRRLSGGIIYSLWCNVRSSWNISYTSVGLVLYYWYCVTYVLFTVFGGPRECSPMNKSDIITMVCCIMAPFFSAANVNCDIYGY